MAKLKFTLFCILLAVFSLLHALEIRCSSDLHGNLPLLPRLYDPLQSSDPDTLRIDAGDTIQGSFITHLDKGKTVIAAMNLLRYDVWVPGNHDFEFGPEVLSARCKEFRGTVLGADWSCKSFTPKPWSLFEKAGKRIAVIGLTEPQMSRRQPPESGFVFKDPLTVLSSLMPQLRSASPDHIILVWHNGLYSKTGSLYHILRKFPEIDLVIGGHTHQEHPGQIIGRSYFIQAGSHGEYVGAVTLNGKEITSRLLSPAQPSPELLPLAEETGKWSSQQAEIQVDQPLSPAQKLREEMQTSAAIVTYIPPLKPRMTLLERYRAFPYEDRYVKRFFTPQAFEEFCKTQQKKQKRWKMKLDVSGTLPPEGGWVALSCYLAGEMPAQKD